MNNVKRYILFSVVSIMTIACTDQGPVHVSGILIDNAVIYIDADSPTTDAMYIENGYVVATGDNAKAMYKPEKGERINMNGQTILPGLVDSHIHPFLALERTTCSLKDTENSGLEMIVASVNACLSSSSPTTQWISVSNYMGYGADTKEFLGQYSSMAEGLSQISDSQPVILIGMDGHAYAVNQYALDRLQIDAVTHNQIEKKHIEMAYPEYVDLFGYNESGQVNGIVKSQAAWDLFAYDTSTAQDFIDNPEWLNSYLLSHGITAAHETFAVDRDIEAYTAMAANDDLWARIYVSVVLKKEDIVAGDVEASVKKFVKRVADLRDSSAQSKAKIIGVKIMVDGVIEYPQQTAAISQPYLNVKNIHDGHTEYGPVNHDHKGVLELSQSTMGLVVLEASQAGLSVHFHAIGDRATDAAISAIEQTKRQLDQSVPTHTISHLQQVDDALIKRMAAAGIAASYTPAWVPPWKEYDQTVIPYMSEIDDINNLDSLYNQESRYMKMLYPIQTMINHDIVVAFGSDAPVDEVSPRPFANMVAATSRSSFVEGREGVQEIVMNSQERTTAVGALRAFTTAAAKTLQDEKLGSLQSGSYADFIVINQDFPKLLGAMVQADDYTNADYLCDEALGDSCSVQVLETWVAGKKVWSAN